MTCYRRVTYELRCQIFAYLESNLSVEEIARRVSKHRSTIYRELARNGRGGRYGADQAHKRARLSFRACRRRRLLAREDLAEVVLARLKDDWSPEQVSARLKREKVGNVSHQTIYTEIRRHREEWAKYLRRYGHHRGRGRARRRKHPEWLRGIEERPAAVLKRKTIGHWERDTMYAFERKQLLVAQERKSRFTLIAKLDPGVIPKLASQTQNLLERAKCPVLTITNDNGNEFMDAYCHEVPVYYCDPHSPYQKGSVENSIGLLRQYIGKHADLNKISPDQLRAYELKLNLRPRKCLDWLTPHEVLYGKSVALAV